MDLLEFYGTNKDFREYVDKYCVKHKLTVGQALEHKLIGNVAQQYYELALRRQGNE